MKHRLLKGAYRKVYYPVAEKLIRSRELKLPAEYSKRRNVFIYFDYEREFGGYETDICDNDISFITDFLASQRILATWFTVGKIFEKYPESISGLISNGHELGSHTWGHVPPLWTGRRALAEDFRKFSEFAGGITKIEGFHPPNGKWSLHTGSLLAKYGYNYDLVKPEKLGSIALEYSAAIKGTQKIIRLFTMGDDWPLHNKKATRQEVYAYFESVLNKISPGAVGGIGFHPWVLLSDNNILEGFMQFIRDLAEREEFYTTRACDFVWVLSEFNKEG